MEAARRSPLHRLLLAGVAALLALVWAAVAATPAAAHDSLISSDPAADATVAAMPETVTLSFSAALLTMSPQDTVVEILSPSGDDVSSGDAVVDGAMVRQATGAVTEPGEYTVNWHVVSSDGHPTEGTFAFTVEAASTPEETASAAVPPANDETAPPQKKPAVTPSPIQETPAASDTGDDDSSFGETLPWILLGLTGAAIVGALTAVLITRGRGKGGDDRRDEDERDAPDHG